MASEQSKVNDLLKELEKQGCTVIPTRSGAMILFPNGEDKLTIHRTASDHRAMKNARSIVKRAGLFWPGDQKN